MAGDGRLPVGTLQNAFLLLNPPGFGVGMTEGYTHVTLAGTEPHVFGLHLGLGACPFNERQEGVQGDLWIAFLAVSHSLHCFWLVNNYYW